jgi:hypothetical protein
VASNASSPEESLAHAWGETVRIGNCCYPLTGAGVRSSAAEGDDGEGGWGLTFAAFDITQVLEKGAPLLASQGQEYDVADVGGTHAERVQRQRQQLRKKLGLDSGGLAEGARAQPPAMQEPRRRRDSDVWFGPCFAPSTNGQQHGANFIDACVVATAAVVTDCDGCVWRDMQ